MLGQKANESGSGSAGVIIIARQHDPSTIRAEPLQNDPTTQGIARTKVDILAVASGLSSTRSFVKRVARRRFLTRHQTPFDRVKGIAALRESGYESGKCPVSYHPFFALQVIATRDPT